GWITPNFAAYVERAFSNGIELDYVKDGMVSFVNGNAALSDTFYAVAAGDYDGAWMILRDASKSTILFSHTAAQGLVKRWEDITAPEVEALHPARSNTKVLIQVHRSRITLDQQLFKDPALAVWHVGDPAPKS